MTKFKDKYRIESTRLRNWDYGRNASYFITICTQNRECYFGDIVDGEMTLSEIGKIASAEWLKTFEMRPDMNLCMGEFVVMPNHFHAIIGIGENRYNTARDSKRRGAMHCASTTTKNQFGPQSKNLASIIRGFKIGVTKNARIINAGFAWQPRYHDHIIRTDESYQRIKQYINNNPKNWDNDTLKG
jgi:REP element-mobilizing transposase RayT